MQHITLKDLQAVVDRINRVTGSPMASYTKDAGGRYRVNIGNYHLDSAYGGYDLCRMSNDGGGVTSMFNGHFPNREIYYRMHAFLSGFDTAQQGKG